MYSISTREQPLLAHVTAGMSVENLGSSPPRFQSTDKVMQSPIKRQVLCKPPNVETFGDLPNDLQSLVLPLYFVPQESEELRCAQVSQHAAKVTSLAEFFKVLGRDATEGGNGSDTIPSVRKDLQAQLLLTLGYRILWLPAGDREAAFAALESAAADSPDELRSVRMSLNAAKVRSFDEFETALQKLGDVRKDLWLETLLTLAYRIHMLPRDEKQSLAALNWCAEAEKYSSEIENKTIEELTDVAYESVVRSHPAVLRAQVMRIAIADVRGGESIPAVVNRYCIEDLRYLEHLETAAIQAHAGKKVLAGEDLELVAKRSGITSTRGLAALEHLANKGRSDRAAHTKKHTSWWKHSPWDGRY